MNWRVITAIQEGGPGRLIATLDCEHTAMLKVSDLNKTAAENPAIMVGQRKCRCLTCPEGEEDGD